MLQKNFNCLLVFCLFNGIYIISNADTSKITLLKNSMHFNDTEDEAALILHQAEKTSSTYYLKLRKQFLTNSEEDEHYESEFREFKAQLALDLSRYNYEKFTYKKRQVKRLSKLQLDGLPKDQFEKAIGFLNKMESLSLRENIKTRDNMGTFSLEGTVLRTIQTNTDADELLYYWNEWRNVVRSEAKMYLKEYRRYYRKAATLNGHITPSKTWYLYYEDDDFLFKLTKVMEDLMPLYKELHAYLRHSIRKRYGNKIPYYKPIPHHFMEQIMEQDWYSRSVFTVPYPNNTLPDVTKKLNEKLPDGREILNASIWFYTEGLGLPPFSDDFLTNYALPLTPQHNTGECKSIPKKFPPEYGIRFCTKIGFKKFLQMHQAVAKLMYYKESINLPLGLNDEPCPGFADAIGEASVIAAGSPRHLQKLKIVENYTTNAELKMNRLFRMAVHTLLSTFQYFINEKFWADFLDEKISDEQMNCEYWKLQMEWAGVSPPANRNNEIFDASYKFYKGLSDEKSSTKRLISEILGYQFYEAICKQNSQYSPDNSNSELSTCDIFGSTDAGKKMGQMMSKGSNLHWHDVMHILTGTYGLNASAMINYYAPLYEWLKDYNEKHHIRTGWEITDFCD